MSKTGYPTADQPVLTRGFAVIPHASEYLDLITRHPALSHGDYGAYLVGLHDRMSAARRAGTEVLIGPFLTDQYESYAEAIGEPADSIHALNAYDDFIARVGPQTRAWTGEPISRVIISLRQAADAQPDRAGIRSSVTRAAGHAEPQRAAREAIGAAEPTSPARSSSAPG